MVDFLWVLGIVVDETNQIDRLGIYAKVLEIDRVIFAGWGGVA